MGAMRSRVGWSVAVVLTILAAGAPAEAQPWTGERWVRGRPHRVEGDAAFFRRDGGAEQWAFSPGIRARIRAVDEHPLSRDAFILDVDLAWRSVAAWGAADSFRVGNPYLGVRFGWRDTIWVARGGVGTTAPLTNAFDDGPGDHAAYRLGQAVLGMWDPWLLEPEIQPLVVRGDFEIHSQYVLGGFEAALGTIFPLRRAGGGNTEWVFQTGAFGAFTPIPEIAIGLRFQMVFATNWRVGFAGVDDAQLALIPFFRVDLEPAFFELRLLMNLDEPHGWAFDDGVWAVSLTAGGRF